MRAIDVFQNACLNIPFGVAITCYVVATVDNQYFMAQCSQLTRQDGTRKTGADH